MPAKTIFYKKPPPLASGPLQKIAGAMRLAKSVRKFWRVRILAAVSILAVHWLGLGEAQSGGTKIQRNFFNKKETRWSGPLRVDVFQFSHFITAGHFR